MLFDFPGFQVFHHIKIRQPRIVGDELFGLEIDKLSIVSFDSDLRPIRRLEFDLLHYFSFPYCTQEDERMLFNIVSPFLKDYVVVTDLQRLVCSYI